MPALRILIVDDHNLFRQGLIRILGDYDQLQIVGEAANGQEALRLVDDVQPDLLLMDVNMPVMSGPEAVQALRGRYPDLPVVMLTVSERDEDLFEAIRAGANGYLLKNVGAAELLEGIQRVYAGEAMVAPPMAARLLEEFRNLPAPASQETEQASVEALSERETDVLRLVAQGLANKEIADALGLSEHTVKTHLQNILDKLQLRSRAHAAAYAVQAGVVKTVHPKR
jgi:two-component system NarL family response regulator